uniref:vWA domain-containing protein n=1 Tax=Gorillibacterium massiliense TaxID=1280390 RepID=UPI000592E123
LAFPSGLGTVFAQTERKADIVFVIDTTGSMGGVISNVKNNVTQFVDLLASNNINARLGLVTFKDIYADGYYSTSNYGWYANSTDFKNTLAGIGADGGGDTPESAVDGLEEARRMSFNTLSKNSLSL